MIVAYTKLGQLRYFMRDYLAGVSKHNLTLALLHYGAGELGG